MLAGGCSERCAPLVNAGDRRPHSLSVEELPLLNANPQHAQALAPELVVRRFLYILVFCV
jgi:hypothetical protein